MSLPLPISCGLIRLSLEWELHSGTRICEQGLVGSLWTDQRSQGQHPAVPFIPAVGHMILDLPWLSVCAFPPHFIIKRIKDITEDTQKERKKYSLPPPDSDTKSEVPSRPPHTLVSVLVVVWMRMSTWSPIGGTVWEGVGGVVLLEKACHSHAAPS